MKTSLFLQGGGIKISKQARSLKVIVYQPQTGPRLLSGLRPPFLPFLNQYKLWSSLGGATNFQSKQQVQSEKNIKTWEAVDFSRVRLATPTRLPLQIRQGSKNNGRSRIMIPCHLGLGVIFWSYFGRCHSWPEPVVDILILPILPVEWLHIDGKFIIYGLCFLANHIRLNMLKVTRILSLHFSRTYSRGDWGHAVLQLIGDQPQQMGATVW
jgi:hypothetical protein